MFSGLLRRLKIFREQNEEDITVLNYFDELEIHPENISEYCLSVRERESQELISYVTRCSRGYQSKYGEDS